MEIGTKVCGSKIANKKEQEERNLQEIRERLADKDKVEAINSKMAKKKSK